MKILFLSKQLDGHGGMETISAALYQGLNQANRCHFIFFAGSKAINTQWLSNVSFEICDSKLPKFLRLLQYKNYLRKQIKSIAPDIIVCLDPDCCEVAKSVQTQSPVVSWLHFSIQAFKSRDIQRLKQADYHIAIAPGILDQLRGQGVSEAVSTYIPNFVEPKDARLLKNENDGCLNLVYVGRVQFETDKYLKDLFDALVSLKIDWHLDIVGSGAEFQRCQEYALAKLGNDEKNITWHGWQANPWEYLLKKSLEFNYLILTSHREGFPMVILEAFSYGLPCICSDINPGTRGIVTGEMGLLYPCGDVGALHALLEKSAPERKWHDREIKDNAKPYYKNEVIDRFDRILKKWVIDYSKK